MDSFRVSQGKARDVEQQETPEEVVSPTHQDTWRNFSILTTHKIIPVYMIAL